MSVRTEGCGLCDYSVEVGDERFFVFVNRSKKKNSPSTFPPVVVQVAVGERCSN